jgi:DNA anti-recombination protein RmuC
MPRFFTWKSTEQVDLVWLREGQITRGERMSQELLQTIIVAVVAVLLLFQTTVLVGFVLLLVRIRQPLEELIANAREVVGIARRRAEQLDVTLAQISQMVQNRVEQADSVARELLDASRAQVLAADRLLGDLVRRIENTTEQTERIVKKPFREVHALNAGVRAALGSLFPRSKSRTSRQHA